MTRFDVTHTLVPDAQRVNVKPVVFRDPKNSREFEGWLLKVKADV